MDKKAIIEALRDKPQLGRPDIKGIPRRVTDAVNRNIATLLGTPVDAVTNAINLGIAGAGTLGHKLGLVSTPPNVIESPIGGSEWFGQQMEQRGMVSPERNTYNEVMAGLLMPAATTRAAKTLFNAEQQAARNIAAPDTLNTPGFRGQRGAIVWHGSPHKFDAFDASKIGTGEGAQAYGHGIYVTELPDVATRYRDTLTNFRPDHIEAKLVEAGISPEFANTYSQFAAQTKGGARGLDDFAELMGKPGPSPYIEQFRQRIRAELPAARSASDAIAGSLYKVDLPDETIARMLDWDKPLSQQAPDVQKAIKKSQFYKDALARYKETKQWYDDPKQKTGQSLHQYMQSGFGDEVGKGMTPEAAAAYLRAQGIPGIRYLDAGSRATGGTSNFVVFPGEERLLRILERNNQPMGLMGVK
jgi:hypothetical protein